MEQKASKKRAKVLTSLVFLVFAVLVGRLAYLQFFQVEKFTTLAKQNHMRLIPIEAPRGEMYSRDGETKIVSNKPVYTVSLVYLGLENTSQVAQRLATLLPQITTEEILQKLDQQKLRLYQPVKIAAGVSFETVQKIEEHRLEMPGVIIDVEPVRDYPQGDIAAQVLGYVRQISKEELEANKDKGYGPNDEIGKEGLERVYEEYLRGTPGARQVEVDAQGRPVRDLGISKPVPGDNLTLTLDRKLQRTAEEALAKQIERLQKDPDTPSKAGATVVVDVNTGGILAMANYPTYDPDLFVGILSTEKYNEITKIGATSNRAIEKIYNPGSTVKPLVGAAALETEAIEPEFTIYDPGYFKAEGTQKIWDWQRRALGQVDLYRGIRESVNTYFCTLGVKIGREVMTEYAKLFGLGTKLGVDLPREESGTILTPERKYDIWSSYLSEETKQEMKKLEAKYNELLDNAETKAERKRLQDRFFAELNLAANSQKEREYIWEMEWRLYDTAYMAIGQGDSKYTPLQLAMYTSAIANGGTLYKPHLVKKITDYQDKLIKEFSGPEVIRDTNVSSENLAVIREGMRQVAEAGGTAYGALYDLPVQVAAKTGTAEFNVYEEGKVVTYSDGIMIAFAPADNPEIAVATVIEYGGSGSGGAGPVVHDILASYFGGKLVDEKWVYPAEENDVLSENQR
ncbi:MAG: penicillin-binding protein 2 [Firmicutes bacterium]|nr:penicillin-binding protein 2 [Bacillota bacterium]